MLPAVQLKRASQLPLPGRGWGAQEQVSAQ